MKKQRKILFKLILLLAVFICNVFHAYSNISTHPYNIEITANMNNSLISSHDSIGDDQIIVTNECYLIVGSTIMMLIPGSFFIFYNYLYSIWQPPEN